MKKTLKLILEYFKINLQSAMEYRINFISQAVFMFVNDIAWIIFWGIFFNKFSTVNAWSFKDIALMFMIITIAWGGLGVVFGNFSKIAQVIRQGHLDYYLALPREELTHLLISKAKFHAFGDLGFGIVMAIIFLPITKLPLAIILIILSMTILLAFAIILGSLSFHIGSSVELSESGLWSILSIGTYPFSAFSGYARIILLTIIPAGFISGIPVELLRNFSIKWLLIMFAFAIGLMTLAIIIFKRGIRKYESGNLINVRV